MPKIIKPVLVGPRVGNKITKPSALDVQVGGGHYKKLKIQPVEFTHANNLTFLEGCVVKRICRWRDKAGIEDLKKIKHEIDLIIQLEGLEEK